MEGGMERWREGWREGEVIMSLTLGLVSSCLEVPVSASHMSVAQSMHAQEQTALVPGIEQTSHI